MTNFKIGDTVIPKDSKSLYTVSPVPCTFKNDDWATDPNIIWIKNKDGDVFFIYANQIEHVTTVVDGQRYLKRQIPEYGLCLVPITYTVDNAPVGSLWRGIKGGRYVVINTEGDAFDFNTQKVYKLPKTAEFVALKAENITVNHKEGQL